MHPIRTLLFTLLLCALGVPALCAAPAEWTPGQGDVQFLAELQVACQAAPLRQTQLKDVAPQYWVEADPTLSWEAALAEATRLFPDGHIKRILYLAHYLKEGDPISRIADMRIPAGLNIGIRMGVGTFTTYELTDTPMRATTAVVTPGQEAQTVILYQPSPIGITIGQNRHTLLGPSSIVVRDVTVNGMAFADMHFRMDGTLSGFSREIMLPDSPVKLIIEGGASPADNTNYYHARVEINGKWRETISYSSEKLITDREVYTPEGLGHTLYNEDFTDGKLTKRVWYKEVETETGTQRIIDRTETF